MFHESMRVNFVEPKLLVQPVGISRGEEANAQSVDGGMLHRRVDHERAKTKTSVTLVDEDITEPRECRLVAHPARESYLSSLRAIATHHDRVAHRPLYLIERPAE